MFIRSNGEINSVQVIKTTFSSTFFIRLNFKVYLCESDISILKLFKGEIISFKEGIGMSERNTKHVIKMLVAFFVMSGLCAILI